MDIKRFHIGDSCLCWQLGQGIDRQLSARVILAYRRVKSEAAAGRIDILDVVPSYNALAVHFDPATVDIDRLVQRIDALMATLPQTIKLPDGRKHSLPVQYDGPDLGRVARHCGLTPAKVVSIHSAGAYQVAMIGFKPHYPYLIGLDPRLETPRLETPRTSVPAGAVAIGGAQTGVYPSESPGGWNIIGSTDPQLLKSIEPGDMVRFRQVERKEPHDQN